MWVDKKVNKSNKIKRLGVLNTVELPKEKGTHRLIINRKTNSISFKEGVSEFIVGTEVGFLTECAYNLFLCIDCFVLELKHGAVYVKENESVYKISESGKKTKEKNLEDSIYWVSHKDICHIISLVSTPFKSDLTDRKMDIENNIVYTLQTGYNTTTKCFDMKLLDTFLGFDLGKFELYKEIVEHTDFNEVIETFVADDNVEDDDVDAITYYTEDYNIDEVDSDEDKEAHTKVVSIGSIEMIHKDNED